MIKLKLVQVDLTLADELFQWFRRIVIGFDFLKGLFLEIEGVWCKFWIKGCALNVYKDTLRFRILSYLLLLADVGLDVLIQNQTDLFYHFICRDELNEV